jgi:hypothetical protein
VCPAPATVEAKTAAAEMVKAKIVKAKIVETKIVDKAAEKPPTRVIAKPEDIA